MGSHRDLPSVALSYLFIFAFLSLALGIGISRSQIVSAKSGFFFLNRSSLVSLFAVF